MIRSGTVAVLALAVLGWAVPATARPSLSIQVAESGRGDGGGSGESLSSKLSRSGGVIAPKEDVDPQIHKPAPEPQPNSTPVIPPSANGGNSAK